MSRELPFESRHEAGQTIVAGKAHDSLQRRGDPPHKRVEVRSYISVLKIREYRCSETDIAARAHDRLFAVEKVLGWVMRLGGSLVDDVQNRFLELKGSHHAGNFYEIVPLVRCDKQQSAAGLQNAKRLREKRERVCDVFYHEVRVDKIEVAFRQFSVFKRTAHELVK